MAHEDRKKAMGHAGTHGDHCSRLLLMVALSFAAMYVLMYAMVNAYANVYNSVNQFYMAGLMAAPMMVIERHSFSPFAGRPWFQTCNF
jgi:ABC-type Na+ efflux pump permease subunit